MLAGSIGYARRFCLLITGLTVLGPSLASAEDGYLRVKYAVRVELPGESGDPEIRLQSLLKGLRSTGLGKKEADASEESLRRQMRAEASPCSAQGYAWAGYGPGLLFSESLTPDRQGGNGSIYSCIVSDALYLRGSSGAGGRYELFKVAQMNQGSLRADVFAFTGKNLFHPVAARKGKVNGRVFAFGSSAEWSPYMVVEGQGKASEWRRILIYKDASLGGPATAVYERMSAGRRTIITKVEFLQGRETRRTTATEIGRTTSPFALTDLIRTGSTIADQVDGAAPEAQISYAFTGSLPTGRERAELRVKRFGILGYAEPSRSQPNVWLIVAGAAAIIAGAAGLWWRRVKKHA